MEFVWSERFSAVNHRNPLQANLLIRQIRRVFALFENRLSTHTRDSRAAVTAMVSSELCSNVDSKYRDDQRAA